MAARRQVQVRELTVERIGCADLHAGQGEIAPQLARRRDKK